MEPSADVWLDAESGTLHHKYMILDVNKHAGRPTLITGSSNWSSAANNENDENILMIEDFRVANLYYQEFAPRYHAAGGTADLTVDVPDGAILSRSTIDVFPNPVATEVTVRFVSQRAGGVDLAIYDVQGRLLETRRVNLAGTSESSVGIGFASYAAGTYFLKISGAGLDEERRITVLK